MQEVTDSSTLAQELWIGDDVKEVRCDAVALDRAADPLVGVDRHRTLFHDDLVAGKRTGDLARDGFDVGEVSVPVLALGGTNGDKDGVGAAGSLSQIGHEADLAIAVPLQQLGEVLLIDKGVAALKRRNLALVVIDADDIVPHLRKADRSDQTYIT